MNNIIETIVAAPDFSPGHVWLAGAGPGHPRYLTLEVADALARTGEPVVVYMGVSTIGMIAGLLMEGGLAPETPVAVLMSATTPDERSMIATLETVEAEVQRQDVTAPALIVIGKIVSMQSILSGGNR